jgi:urease alpha subunit
MTRKSLAPIKDVDRGAASGDGLSVELDLRLEDGTVLELHCPHHRLGHVVTAIQAAAGHARDARRRANPLEGLPGDIDAAEPFRVTGIAVGSAIGHDLVAVRTHTEQGITVDLAFDRERVRALIDALEDALRRNRVSARRKPD